MLGLGWRMKDVLMGHLQRPDINIEDFRLKLSAIEPGSEKGKLGRVLFFYQIQPPHIIGEQLTIQRK